MDGGAINRNEKMHNYCDALLALLTKLFPFLCHISYRGAKQSLILITLSASGVCKFLFAHAENADAGAFYAEYNRICDLFFERLHIFSPLKFLIFVETLCSNIDLRKCNFPMSPIVRPCRGRSVDWLLGPT